MSSPKYRVFIRTKQGDRNNSEWYCYNCGALEIYQVFQEEIQKRQLEDCVKICSSISKLSKQSSLNNKAFSFFGCSHTFFGIKLFLLKTSF